MRLLDIMRYMSRCACSADLQYCLTGHSVQSIAAYPEQSTQTTITHCLHKYQLVNLLTESLVHFCLGV